MSQVSEAVKAERNKQRYTDHFNKIGTSAEDSANLIADYEKNTKGLDADQAWNALEGGRQFDPQGGDKERYDKMKAGEGKERAQNYKHQQMNQNANQDNDVTSTITGDNNTVRIDQDNSVRQYGGVNKSFVYNGSSNGNNYEDTPVSAGTMGGYFHDEDSPGRSASFVDRYTTMNDDYQKKYKSSSHAQDAINAAKNNQTINVGALDQKINDRAQASRARSTVMAGEIFGDMFNYKPEDWRNPDKQEEVETPDFKKLGKI